MGTEVRVADPRAGAQIWKGHSECLENAVRVLQLSGLPGGLLPLDNMEELGHVPETGFFWLKQRKGKTHFFKAIGRSVWYAVEISGYLSNNSLTSLTGIKAKELLIWVTIVDILSRDSHPNELFFRSSAGGLGKWYPRDAFALEKK